MKHITVREAATILGVSMQAIYQAIWRRTLKSTKIEGKNLTTIEWIQDYQDHLHSKQEHSMFNGEKVYCKEKGHLSVRMVAEALNIKEQCVYDMIKYGKVKQFRKGLHFVILQEELASIQKILDARKKIA